MEVQSVVMMQSSTSSPFLLIGCFSLGSIFREVREALRIKLFPKDFTGLLIVVKKKL